MEKEIPCPGCCYNLAGLAGLVCPECGRVFTMADVGGRPRPPWLRFAMCGWGWLTLLVLDVVLLSWVISLNAPSSETLRLLFFGGPATAGVGAVAALMVGFLIVWFFQRVSRRPRVRARAGGTLLVAWVLTVIQLLGVVGALLLG